MKTERFLEVEMSSVLSPPLLTGAIHDCSLRRISLEDIDMLTLVTG